MESALQDRIRERAYHLWVAAGRIDGQAQQHWLAAERQVASEMKPKLSALETSAENQRQRPKSNAMKSEAPRKRRSKPVSISQLLR
jgi:hypothetical protein